MASPCLGDLAGELRNAFLFGFVYFLFSMKTWKVALSKLLICGVARGAWEHFFEMQGSLADFNRRIDSAIGKCDDVNFT